MTNQVTSALQQGLLTLLLAAITAAVSIGVAVINMYRDKLSKQIESIKDSSTRELAKSALNNIADMTVTVVSSIEQEEAKDLRELIKSGNATRDQLCALKDKAVERIKSQITEETAELAKKEVANLDKYISDKVSEVLMNIKNNTLTLTSETTVSDK